jgi:hypothetical protein
MNHFIQVSLPFMMYWQHGAAIAFGVYSALLVGRHFRDPAIVGPIGKTIFITCVVSTVAYAVWWRINNGLVS